MPDHHEAFFLSQSFWETLFKLVNVARLGLVVTTSYPENKIFFYEKIK